MATIKKQGTGYKISVSHGYDINGKQLREHMTWTPPAGMTARQLEKELNRQATLFEEQVKCSATHDGNIRLKEFTDIFLADYARPNLKAKTVFNYEKTMERANAALGHIKLKELKPGHIASFYANLQEPGMRGGVCAVSKIDLDVWMRDNSTTMTELSKRAGVSVWILKQIKSGKRVAQDCAQATAAAIGMKYATAFDTVRDMNPLSAGTIHTYHRILSAVLFRAVKWGYISTNPASCADLPSIANRQAAYLDEPDARRMLELLQGEPVKWRAMVALDLLSGLRRGELCGLRWSDVLFDSECITVRQTSNYLPGRGVYVDTTKTATSNRPLRLARVAFLLLLEYKQWQDAQREALGDAWVNADDRVFTRDDGRPLSPDSLTQWFHKFLVKNNFPPKISVHSMRHTYASLMIADGTPLVVVSHNLGHAQVSTTSNIYSHVIASAEAKAAQSFDKFNNLVMPADADQRTG